MSHLNILVIGKNLEILETLRRVIQNTEGWLAVITDDEEKAYGLLRNQKFDLALLSSGLDLECEVRIKSNASVINPDIKVIEHFGGGSGLLKSEILSAFPHLTI